MNTSSLIRNASVLGIIGALSLAVTIAAAWTSPSGSPPTLNVDAPINVGVNDQTKTGGLLTVNQLWANGGVGINSGSGFCFETSSCLRNNGTDFYFYNSNVISRVGINTQSPIALLDIRATGFIDNPMISITTDNLTGSHGNWGPTYTAFAYSDDATLYTPRIALLRARGTQASKSPLQAGDVIGTLAGFGWSGSSFAPSPTFTSPVAIRFDAQGSFTDSSTPTSISFFTTPANQTGGFERVNISPDGNVGIGTSAPVATLDVNGYARLKPQTAAPVVCDAAHKGSIAIEDNSGHICVCNLSGGTYHWRFDFNNVVCSTW